MDFLAISEYIFVHTSIDVITHVDLTVLSKLLQIFYYFLKINWTLHLCILHYMWRQNLLLMQVLQSSKLYTVVIQLISYLRIVIIYSSNCKSTDVYFYNLFNFLRNFSDKFDTASFYSSFSVESKSAPNAGVAIIALCFL